MLKSSLCDYSDAHILVSGTITIDGEEADDPAKRLDEREKGVIFENCVPFTDCISEIYNTQIDWLHKTILRLIHLFQIS